MARTRGRGGSEARGIKGIEDRGGKEACLKTNQGVTDGTTRHMPDHVPGATPLDSPGFTGP
jgi:hypothetical protein